MKNVYFFTDVHGRYELFEAMCKWCYSQDNECMIIYGGDAADRGPDGYRIMNELLDDPQIVYLYGNHEDLFVKAADAIIGFYAATDEQYDYIHHCNEEQAKAVLKKMRAYDQEDVKLHLHNGGEPTLMAWLCNGANEDFIDRIRELPRTFSYENIDFCHAGGTYSAFKFVANAEYEGTERSWYDEELLIWDRNCIALGWKTGRICVHGHTPTPCLPARVFGRDVIEDSIHPCSWYDMMGARKQRGGLKIDMDTGMTFTGEGFVLDCLTLKATGFEDPAIPNPTMPHNITMIQEYSLRRE